MSPLRGKWQRIRASEPLPRSSHSLNVINGNAYIFGGEVEPRKPVDNVVHVVSLPGNTNTNNHSNVSGNENSPAPSPRVGHTAATIGTNAYVFGGRGGPAMAPLEEDGAVWQLDTLTSTWSLLEADESSPRPSARSYHASVGVPDSSGGSGSVIIHAGCPSSGRLSDLWSFDVASCLWTELPSAPQPERGGTSLAYASGRLWRFGGFDGKTELGGGIDCLSLEVEEQSGRLSARERSWETVPFTSALSVPGNRSVCGLEPIKTKDGETHLILLLGERDASSKGHEGAGKFWGDVWSFHITGQTWNKVEIESGEGPGQRGWIAGASEAGGSEVVVWGGLNEENQRCGDGWVLVVE